MTSTSLASWAQLRHDTILYVKQSYTMDGKGDPPLPPRIVGLVEPLPGFYGRLRALSAIAKP